MFRQTKTCPQCGASIDKRASFCHECGAPQTDAPAQRRCGSCGALVPVTAKFCRDCGERLDATKAPRIGDNRWRRGEDDFATHVVVDDVKGFLSRDLIVEPGTQVILLADGASVGTLGPGKYQMDDLSKRGAVALNLRSAHRIEAILVDTADTELEFTIGNIYTQDPLNVTVTCMVDVKVDSPMRFFQTMMRSRRSYPAHELRDYLYGEVEDAAGEWLGKYSVEDLRTNLKVKHDLEMAIQAHLQDTEDRNGLQFVRVRALDLAHPYMDRVTQQQAELFISSAEAEEAFRAERARVAQERRTRGLITEEELAKAEDALTRRKSLYAVFNQDQLQDLYEEEQKVMVHERRAKLWERMRRSVLSDRMAELRGEHEMETFLREQDHQRLLEEKDWQELQQTIQEEQDDHQSLRAHLLAKTQMERDYELRQIEFLQRTDLEEAELDWEIEHTRRELEGQQEIDRRRWEYELAKRERQAAVSREQRELDDIARRERDLQDTQTRLDIQLQEARTQAEVARIEQEQNKADFELGAMALERMKAIRRHDEAERRLAEIDAKRRESEIRIEEEERRLRLKLEQERAQHDHELAVAKMNNDAEIRAGELQAQVETARITAEVSQIEALHGLSDKQVESIMAAKSPDYARSLADQAKAAAEGQLNEEQLQHFEQEKARLRAEAEVIRREAREERMEQRKRDHEAHMRLIETMGETVQVQAQASQSPTVVVTPGTGTSGVTSIGGATPPSAAQGQSDSMIICPRCHLQSPAGTKFCQNCGYDFFATPTS